MHILSSRVLALFSLVAMSVFSPVNAATITATYRGTIAFGGFDTTGEFGAPSTNLEGERFVATYVYDLNLGDRSRDIGRSDGLVGGFPPSFNFGNPLISGSLTIKGRTQNFLVERNGFFFSTLSQPQNIGHVTSFFDPLSPNVTIILRVQAAGNDIVPSIEARYDNIPIRGGGNFLISDFAPGTGLFNRFAEGQFRLETLSVSSSVPEPSTWLFLTIGFGFIGFCVRRRNQTIAHSLKTA